MKEEGDGLSCSSIIRKMARNETSGLNFIQEETKQSTEFKLERSVDQPRLDPFACDERSGMPYIVRTYRATVKSKRCSRCGMA